MPCYCAVDSTNFDPPFTACRNFASVIPEAVFLKKRTGKILKYRLNPYLCRQIIEEENSGCFKKN
jgi:hypothetical protein